MCFWKKRKEKKSDKSEKLLWNMDDYNRKYADPIGSIENNGSDNMILTKDIMFSMDGEKTDRNQNMLIIGGSGSGKSFKFVVPNLLQANASYVVSDPYGELYTQYGAFLESEGYNIKVLNLEDDKKSNHYNPLQYLRTEADIYQFTDSILRGTYDPKIVRYVDKQKQKETDRLLRLLMVAVLGYLIKEGGGIPRTLAGMMQLFREVLPEEGQIGLDNRFVSYEEKHKEDTYVMVYRKFKEEVASYGLQKIMISLFARLQIFEWKEIGALTETDELDLAKIGDEKTALFVIIPNHAIDHRLFYSILYTQVLHALSMKAKASADVVYDENGEVWKTFRGENAESEAKQWWVEARDASVQYNQDMDWWEAIANGERIGHRGTKEAMENAVQALKRGDIKKIKKHLPIHTECILEEFGCTGYIDGLWEAMAEGKQNGVSVLIVSYSLDHIKSIYKETWENIVANCDTWIFLGGIIPEKELLTKFVKNPEEYPEIFEVDALHQLEENECILCIRGMPPYRGEKYNTLEHPNWEKAKQIREKQKE